jgi:hypothetical protein
MKNGKYTEEEIARVCHEANRALQYIQNDPCPSQPWDAVTDFRREATIQGVREVLMGLSPRQLHGKWCEAYWENDWVYGPVKDSVKRTHPCLVEFDELPEAQKDKDRLFQLVVVALTIRFQPDERGWAGDERNPSGSC